MTEQQVAAQIAAAHSPEQILSPSRANTPPPNQQAYSHWGTPPPAVSHFPLFGQRGESSGQSREQSWELPADADPTLRQLPLQYHATKDPKTPPRRELPETPEEPRRDPSEPHDDPFGPDEPPPGPPNPPGDPQGGNPPDQPPGGGPPAGPPGGGPPPPPPPPPNHPLTRRRYHLPTPLQSSLRFQPPR
jgi:hypothetical protein